MKTPTRMAVHRGLNLVLFLGGCLLAGSGWLLGERLPRGREGHGLSFLGLTRHEWGDLHGWLGHGMVACVALHLGLHAAWLHRGAASGRGWRLAAGLGVGVAAVAVFTFLPVRG